MLRVRTVAGEETRDHQLAGLVNALARGTPLPTEEPTRWPPVRVIDAVCRRRFRRSFPLVSPLHALVQSPGCTELVMVCWVS